MSEPGTLTNTTGTALELFPPLAQLDFGKNCDAYGRWLGSYASPTEPARADN